MEGRFCVEEASTEMRTCGKAKIHVTRKHRNLGSGCFIGAGERARSGAHIAEPPLDVDKISQKLRGQC
jgi:hypothetical protein